jgi:hypothetical protein
MHPAFCVATRLLEQTRSWMKGGVVELIYPQHWNFCCSNDCTSGVSDDHNANNRVRVWRVLNHTATPRHKLNKPHTTTSQPWMCNQRRLVGKKNTGSERRKVIKINMALTIAATDELLVGARTSDQ